METPSELNARLAAWRGSRAEVWDHTVSHSILRLHLSLGPNAPSSILCMYDCASVSFSPGWENSAVSVIELAAGVRSCLVTDGRNLRVECGNVAFSAPLSSYAEIPPAAADPPGSPSAG